MIDPPPEERAFPLRASTRSTKWQIVGLIAQTALAVFFGWIAYLAWQAMP